MVSLSSSTSRTPGCTHRAERYHDELNEAEAYQDPRPCRAELGRAATPLRRPSTVPSRTSMPPRLSQVVEVITGQLAQRKVKEPAPRWRLDVDACSSSWTSRATGAALGVLADSMLRKRACDPGTRYGRGRAFLRQRQLMAPARLRELKQYERATSLRCAVPVGPAGPSPGSGCGHLIDAEECRSWARHRAAQRRSPSRLGVLTSPRPTGRRLGGCSARPWPTRRLRRPWRV